jgi:GNAT superfamily N-acetyltransferase
VSDVALRVAVRTDLDRILELLADDAIAAARTEGLGAGQLAAFDAIEADPNNELVVAELDGAVVGVMQLTYVPGLSRHGATRLLVEAVRVDAALRGRGIGRSMMLWAQDRGRARGCSLAQLTSDKRRADAHRFYRSLGYAQSHEGFKLVL